MANTSSRIEIIFEGAVSGLSSAADIVQATIGRVGNQAETTSRSMGTFERSVVRAFGKLGAGAAGVQTAVVAVSGLASAVSQVAPAALTLPGIFLGIGVAVGTVKLALSGFKDAVMGDAESLAKFGVEGQAAVRAVRGLSPEFVKLRNAVSEQFFKGLGPAIKTVGEELYRVGQQQLPFVARSFRFMALEALAAANTPFFKKGLAVIIDDTGDALKRLRFFVADVLIGFIGLGSVGSKFLEPLAQKIADVGKAFRLWVENGLANGSIEAAIERALAALNSMRAVVANVGVGVGNLGRAFLEGLGGPGGALATVEAMSVAFRQLSVDPQVVAIMRTLGETVRVLGDNFRQVLLTAIRELGPAIVAVAPFVAALSTAIKGELIFALELLGPIVLRVAEFLSRNKDVIITLVPVYIGLKLALGVLRTAMVAVMAVRILAFFIGWSRVLAGARIALTGAAIAARVLLGPLLRLAGIAGLALIADQVNEINKAAVGGDVSKLGPMEDTLNNLVEAGRQLLSGDVGGIIADIGSEWDLLVQKFQSGESPAGAAFKKISESFQRDFLDVFAQAPAQIGGFFSSLPGIIGGALSSFGSSIAQFAQPVIDFFVNLPTTIGAALSGLGAFFVTKAQEIWTAFLGGLQSFFGPVLAFFSQSPFEMGFAIGSAIGQFIQVAIDLWNNFLIGCRTGIAAVVAFCAQVPGLIIGAISAFIGMVVAWATAAWNGALTTTTSIVASVVAFCAALPGRIMSAINSFIASAINWARQAWTGVQQTTTSIVSAVLSFVSAIPGRIIAFLASLPGQLRSNATNSWEQFRSGVVQKANEAISFVAGIPGRIVSALGNLGGLLVAQGRAVIDGLLAGIRAGVQAMYDFVSGIAAGIAARKGPISKDRVLLVDQGKAIMQGLQAGLEQGSLGVLGFVSGLAPDIANQLSSLEAASISRARQAAAQRARMGDLVTQVTASNSREAAVPVVNVLLSQERFAELARVEIDTASRETARRVTAGLGQTF